MNSLKNSSLRVLKWLERYTKTDMVYLAKGGFWTILSQIIVSLSTLLLAIAFAHFVSKEVYGEYKYILSIASILGTFTLTGLSSAITKAVTLGYEGTLEYAFWKNIKWSVLFFVLTLGASVYYFANGNVTIGIAMLVIGSLSPVLSSTNLYNAYLVAKKDFSRSAIYFGIIGNVFPALCIFLAILLHSTPLWFVITYFVSNTLIGIILYKKILKIYKPNDKVDEGVVGYSKHLSVIGILGGLANNIDQVLIFHYIGPAQLAIYNFALAIPSQIKGPIKGIAGLIFPKYTEREDHDIRHGMRNKYLVTFVVSLAIIITYVLCAPLIFHTLFPKYLDSIFYSQILSLSLLAIVSIPAEIYFVAKEKIKEQYIANISIPILQIIIMFSFIMWKGILGVVIARVIIKILWSIINISLFEKTSRNLKTI